MKRQFTATTYIVEEEKVLLLFHPKFQKWLPPGGHLELDETPVEAARREVEEETGLQIAFILQEKIKIDRWNAVSMESPFLCLLENIPPHGSEPAHQHIDFIYLARPTNKNALFEQKGLRWFSLEEVLALKTDEEIFADTQEVVAKIFELPANELSPIPETQK